MGWFDEDSSGEEDDVHPSGSSPEKESGKSGPKDDEEDPFDAFMHSLSSSSALETKPEAQRMDMQEEEQDDTVELFASTQAIARSLEEEEDVGESSAALLETNNGLLHKDRAILARKALDSTFLPAGAVKNKTDEWDQQEEEGSYPTAPFNPHDWSQVGVPQLPQSQATTNPKYQAVRKVFWNATDTSFGPSWRKQHEIHCTASIDPILSFQTLRSVVTEGVWQTIERQGYTEPTLVQSQTLPVAMAGRDVLVTAATGQGKTLAYLWPVVVHILDQPHLGQDETGPIALVLVPTRELAQQVHRHAKLLLAADGGTCKTIIGGQGKYLLYQEIKKSGGIEIAVATPGRLLDVLSDNKKKNGLTLERTTMVVLDEADKMLHMGFEAQVRQILRALRPDRQTMLLSATLGRRVEQVAKEWLHSDYVRIAVGKSGESSMHVDQHVIVLPNVQAKRAFLIEMIPTFQAVGRAIIFVATREGCEALAKSIREELANSSVSLDTLHGDKHQSHRTSTLRAFTKGEVSILIATDVAGRGLDVPQVATVVNYDPAKNLDSHVHRIGRAGRLSKEGTQQKGSAYTLLTPKDADFAHVLRNSFVREHRAVSDELNRLADTSRKTGHVTSTRTKGNRAGLGFESAEDTASSSAPPTKRSRWN